MGRSQRSTVSQIAQDGRAKGIASVAMGRVHLASCGTCLAAGLGMALSERRADVDHGCVP